MELFNIFLAVGFVLMILEIMTPGLFVFFSLGISSLIVAVASILIRDIRVLLILFSIVGILVFWIMKKFGIFKFKDEIKTNADKYIGKKVKVIQVYEGGKVRVKVYGEEWNGICSEELKINDDAEIVSIEGITLTLKKI